MRQTIEHPIDIPAGVDSGTRLVDPGQGDAGLRGGQRGDLYVIIYVQPHPHFTRRGMDVVYEAAVTFAQATLGDTFEVPVLGGTEKLTIPEGTQPGTTFRLRGRGFPDVNSRTRRARRSDCQIKLKVPHGSRKSSAVWSKSLPPPPAKRCTPDERGLFEKVKDAFYAQVESIICAGRKSALTRGRRR